MWVRSEHSFELKMKTVQVTKVSVVIILTCLVSCWTALPLSIPVNSLESQSKAEDTVFLRHGLQRNEERTGSGRDLESVALQIQKAKFQQQIRMTEENGFDRDDESTNRSDSRVGSKQSNVEFQQPFGENRLRNREERSNASMTFMFGHHEENWCRVLRRLSRTAFGIRLEAENNSWPDFKLGWRTGSAVILGALGAAVSSAGGLGGGCLFVPLFNLLLQFDAKTSAALSNFMIVGGSLANLFINLKESHPTRRDKPLIDFDVVLLLQPNLLLGISLGVILNVVLPDWVITALLTFTLGYVSIHSLKSGLKRWQKETQQNLIRKNLSVNAPRKNGANDSDISSNVQEETSEITTEGGEYMRKSTETFSKENALSQPLLRKEKPEAFSLPFNSILALAATWLAFFAIQVLRGSKDNQSILGFEACGLGYWLITLTQIPIALGITALTIYRFQASDACKEDPESVLCQEEGFILKPEACTRFAWMALFTGMMGGLLGIGGGLIISPILMTVGMAPQVTAGTCASMVFFSSSMSVVQFWLMGRVPIKFALSGALLSAVSSFVGVTLLKQAIEKYNRASLIVFSVTTVMILSTLLMAGFGGFGVWETYQGGGYMGFHYPC